MIAMDHVGVAPMSSPQPIIVVAADGRGKMIVLIFGLEAPQEV